MIRALAELPEDQKSRALSDIEEIFFLSSASGGSLQGAERRAFYKDWTRHYLIHHPDLVVLAERNGRTIGYLMGCDDSAHAAELFEDLAYYQAFEESHAAFPAHLHINVHPKYRSGGIGAKLVRRFEQLCRARGCAGVHLVTAADARNRAFYERLGYKEAAARRIGDRDLVLLGRRL